MRNARQMTTNTPPASLTAAERSRQMDVLLPQEDIAVLAAVRAALHPEQLQKAIDQICDTFTSAQRISPWDALMLPNADWNTYILRVFILYVSSSAGSPSLGSLMQLRRRSTSKTPLWTSGSGVVSATLRLARRC